MASNLKKLLSLVLIIVVWMASVPRNLPAFEEHVVAQKEFHQTLLSMKEARENQITQIQEFFGSGPGRQILKIAGVTSTKIQTALPMLSDRELSELASKTAALQSNFAAGYHDDTIHILLIVLLIVAIVAIIAAVAD
jgi:hypothetical protein